MCLQESGVTILEHWKQAPVSGQVEKVKVFMSFRSNNSRALETGSSIWPGRESKGFMSSGVTFLEHWEEALVSSHVEEVE